METENAMKTSPLTDGGNNGEKSEEVKRFEVELEFLQCLANPFYLNHLAQHGYFEKREFINYLKYLLYWKEPQYAVFIKYPSCLYLLDLLQEEAFRRELSSPLCAKFVEEQLLLHWQYYAFRRRMAATTIPPGEAPPNAAAENGSAPAGAAADEASKQTTSNSAANASSTTTLQNGV